MLELIIIIQVIQLRLCPYRAFIHSIGTYTGANEYQSDYCTFVGSYAGYDMDGGDRATYAGYPAGYGGGSGTYNTAVGVNLCTILLVVKEILL